MDLKLTRAVGLSLHDAVPINQKKIALSQSGISPVVSSAHDTAPINRKIALSSQTGIFKSLHDNLRVNQSSEHALETAVTGFDIDVNDPKHLLTDKQKAQIKEDMVQAGKQWMDHIANPHHVPINIQINISDDVGDKALANGRPAYTMSTGTGPDATWESAVKYKLEHGAAGDTSFTKMSDGAPADVIININSHDLNQLNFDPNSGKDKGKDKGGLIGGLSDILAGSKINMTSVLAHEFGHGLGIGNTNALDVKTGTFNGSQKTTWESMLDIEKSGTTFTGSNAEREHGGPVVVTTNIDGENYQHFGNSASDTTDPKAHGPELMVGQSLNPNTNYSISPLDVATLQDLGYQTKEPIPFGLHVRGPNFNNIPVLEGHPTPLDIHQLTKLL